MKDLLADTGLCPPMIKDAPSPGRMAAMVGFTLSCFALLLFLWMSFGGTIPLRPEGYRFEVGFKEASLLVKEADVRMAGLNVGKVKAKRLDAKNGITIAELEIDEKYAPIPQGHQGAAADQGAARARPTWS